MGKVAMSWKVTVTYPKVSKPVVFEIRLLSQLVNKLVAQQYDSPTRIVIDKIEADKP
jgi:hypothetical protein